MAPDLRKPCEECGAEAGRDCRPECAGPPGNEDALNDLLMATT